jgi:glycosyltransferase involved in cell wall biosynthesis
MAEVKISIIVPAYNAEKYLERCVTSLLKQDLSSDEYEIIVINDGSTDRTGIILDEYSNRFPNLNCITVPNGGVSEARNRGCKEARGKYFLFVDADDWIQTNVLQAIYESLEKDDLDVLVMDFQYWGEKGELPKDFNQLPENHSLDAEVLSGNNFMQRFLPRVVWCNAYRTDFWREHNLSFLPIRHEDEEIIPKIFYYAKRVRFLPVKFYCYYKNQDSFMMNYDERACFYMLQAMESLDAFRQECVKDKDLNLFLKNLIAKRLLTTFRRGIRWGMPASVQREMISGMKERGFAPLPKGKGFIRTFLYNHCPSLFIAYYRAKEKRAF